MDYNYGELIKGIHCQPRPVQCVQVAQDQKVRVRQLDNEAAIVDWLGSEDSSHIRLLSYTGPKPFVPRHPVDTYVDDQGGVINPPRSIEGLPFSKATLFEISKRFSLPTEWLEITNRKNGYFVALPDQEDEEKESRIGFVIQTPHSSAIKCGLIISYNVASRRSTGIFHSTYQIHQRRFLRLLKRTASVMQHPLLLPVLLLRLYTDTMEGYCGMQDADTSLLEKDTGWTDYYLYKFRTTPKRRPDLIIKQINGTLYALSRFDQFIDFELRLHDYLADLSSIYTTSHHKNNQEARKSKSSDDKLRQWLKESRNTSLSHKQASASLNSRVQAQNSVLYSLVAQRDNQLQYKIARAAKEDSSDMRAIALLTILFLPATFVSTFFSAGLMNFTDPTRATVPKSMWIYWVVTIPLTSLVLAAWFTWSRKHRIDDQVPNGDEDI